MKYCIMYTYMFSLSKCHDAHQWGIHGTRLVPATTKCSRRWHRQVCEKLVCVHLHGSFGARFWCFATHHFGFFNRCEAAIIRRTQEVFVENLRSHRLCAMTFLICSMWLDQWKKMNTWLLLGVQILVLQIRIPKIVFFPHRFPKLDLFQPRFPSALIQKS